MDFRDITPSGVSQSPRANPVVLHFSEVPRGVTPLEAESRWWARKIQKGEAQIPQIKPPIYSVKIRGKAGWLYSFDKDSPTWHREEVRGLVTAHSHLPHSLNYPITHFIQRSCRRHGTYSLTESTVARKKKRNTEKKGADVLFTG